MFIISQSCDIAIYFALFSTIIARFSGQWQESSSKIKNSPSFPRRLGLTEERADAILIEVCILCLSLLIEDKICLPDFQAY